jgi:hypothetical protein
MHSQMQPINECSNEPTSRNKRFLPQKEFKKKKCQA